MCVYIIKTTKKDKFTRKVSCDLEDTGKYDRSEIRLDWFWAQSRGESLTFNHRLRIWRKRRWWLQPWSWATRVSVTVAAIGTIGLDGCWGRCLNRHVPQGQTHTILKNCEWSLALTFDKNVFMPLLFLLINREWMFLKFISKVVKLKLCYSVNVF